MGSLTTQPLYPWGKSPQYPLSRGLGGPCNRYVWTFWKGEESLVLAGI